MEIQIAKRHAQNNSPDGRMNGREGGRKTDKGEICRNSELMDQITYRTRSLFDAKID